MLGLHEAGKSTLLDISRGGRALTAGPSSWTRRPSRAGRCQRTLGSRWSSGALPWWAFCPWRKTSSCSAVQAAQGPAPALDYRAADAHTAQRAEPSDRSPRARGAADRHRELHRRDRQGVHPGRPAHPDRRFHGGLPDRRLCRDRAGGRTAEDQGHFLYRIGFPVVQFERLLRPDRDFGQKADLQSRPQRAKNRAVAEARPAGRRRGACVPHRAAGPRGRARRPRGARPIGGVPEGTCPSPCTRARSWCCTIPESARWRSCSRWRSSPPGPTRAP